MKEKSERKTSIVNRNKKKQNNVGLTLIKGFKKNKQGCIKVILKMLPIILFICLLVCWLVVIDIPDCLFSGNNTVL